MFRMVLTDAIRVLNFRREYAMLINRDDMGGQLTCSCDEAEEGNVSVYKR